MPTSEIASERGDNEVLQQVTDNVDDLEVQDDLYGQQEDRVLNAIDKGDSDAEEDFEADSEEESDKENEMEDAQDGEDEHEEDVVLSNSVSCSDHEVSSDRFEGEFVEIDSERPKVVVGSRFPSVDHFRDALKQHCVTNEFEVKYLKNERCRVTATCRVGKCNWRIHASVLQDGITFEVKTLNEVHTCTSVNKVGNEMATSKWLATKMVPILHKTPELGASKLKVQIKNKYNITLPYTRVQKARTKAIELIHGKPAESYRLIPELREEILKANPNNKDKGLQSNVHLVFPGVEHRNCVRHLYSNFKKKYPGEFFERLVWNCASSYNAASFEWNMREIRMASSPTASYLDAINDQMQNHGENASSKNFGTRWRGKLVPKAFKYVQSLVKDIGEYIVRRNDDYRAQEYGHHRSSCKNPIGISQRGEVGGRDRGRGRGRGRSTRFIHRDDDQVSGVACNTQSHSVGVQRSNMGGTPEMGQGQGFWNGINISTGGGGVSKRGKTLGVKPSGRAISKAPKERVKCPARRGGGAIQNIGTQSSNI
ncbi:hypothetical protein QJS10_CPA02g01268 [Acorus calamus]|uniref:Transposase MuDR plant domain-containing protein n=1 Tax=Acorus calamus TaxID=4465 RepID=A0AAV9FBC7_ACOCL|nr:hypothetical protein QJS10_CPA02g01268 [Acorus calamus]